MKRLLLAVVLAVAAACHGGNAHDDDTPLPHDPRVRVGHLANGLTYYVMKLPEATHRARLWLVVNAGSLEEDDDQRGLAHLVEHMAFRGTRRYPGEAITVFLEHAGLESGPDLDAFTSYEQTRYELAVATDQPGLVAQGFDVLHEWAGAVTFDPAAYELERTVVLEENRLRAGRRMPTFRALDRHHADDGRYAVRDPSGEPAIVEHAPLAAAQRFYRDWYRPDLMAVIAVGDLDPDAAEREIRTRFGDLRGPAAPRPRVEPALDLDPIGVVRTDAGVSKPFAFIELSARPFLVGERTTADTRAALARAMYVEMIKRRLQRGNAWQLAAAEVRSPAVGRRFERLTWDRPGEPGDAAQGVTSFAAELRVADLYGFSDEELARARTDVFADQRRPRMDLRVDDGEDEANDLADDFDRGDDPIDPVARVALLKDLIESIDSDEVVRAGSGDEPRSLLVSSVYAGDRDRAKLHAALDDADQLARDASAPPTPPANAAPAPLMSRPPEPGHIVDERSFPDLGVTEWTLSNGATVDVRPLASDRGVVRITVEVDGGGRAVAPGDALAGRLATSLVQHAGAGAGNDGAFHRALERDHVTTTLRLYASVAQIEGFAPTADVESLLQAVHLWITAPRYSPDIGRSWKRSQKERLAEPTPETGEAALAADLLTAERAGDPSYAPLTAEMIDSVDPARAFAIYLERFADASRTHIAIVGDFDTSDVRPLVARYLATLPSATTHDDGPRAAEALSTGTHTVERFGADPGHEVVRYRAWAAGTTSLDELYDATAIGRVLERRIYARLREEMGAVYHAETTLTVETSGVRTLEISFSCAPADAERLSHAMFDVIEQLRRGGVTDDEVAILRAQSHHRHEDHLRDASWWSSELLSALRTGRDPHDVIDATGFYARLTKPNLDAAAPRMLAFDGDALGFLLPAPAK